MGKMLKQDKRLSRKQILKGQHPLKGGEKEWT